MHRINQVFKNLKCGDLKCFPYAVLKCDKKVHPNYDVNINESAKTLQLIANYRNIFRDSIYINYNNDEIVCKRVFENIDSSSIDLVELGFDICGIDFGGNAKDDYFYHVENPRMYEVMTFPIDYKRTADDAKNSEFDVQAGNRWAEPGVVSERIGASPYQPFPAILVSNYFVNKGIVHGTLNQDVFFHNYLVSHENGFAKLEILSSFKSIDALSLEPGRVIVDEWYLGGTDNADNIEKIFENYINVLRRKVPASYGRTNINRDNIVWGSWNDGLFRNVSEELLLNEAKYLKDNFPTVRWIQLDDGYASDCTEIAHGLGVPYEGDDGIDHNKFPEGLKGYSDKIRLVGLNPALWIGGFCPADSKIYKEHPEWFCDYTYRTTNTAPLDVSIPEVRDYMSNALNTFCRRYGFDGIKLDFWSYSFEDSHNLLKNKNNSGYEYRKWWLKELRKNLPSDGYLQTGCDLVMGNPFLGEYFTNYRYGIDVACGDWYNIKTNFLWGTACFSLHIGDMIVPNSDSIGLLPGVKDSEKLFLINYCIATHSMVELAGQFSLSADEKMMRILKKATCNPNNGQDVYYVGYDYRKSGYTVPEIMYFNTPHFSKISNCFNMPIRTVGLFNIDDDRKEYKFSPSELNISDDEYIITDVWSGEKFDFQGEFLISLAAHESRLLAINLKKDIQIYDANFRINDVQINSDCLSIYTDYALSDAELSLNKQIKEILYNGENVPFKTNNNFVCFDLPGKGKLSVLFS